MALLNRYVQSAHPNNSTLDASLMRPLKSAVENDDRHSQMRKTDKYSRLTIEGIDGDLNIEDFLSHLSGPPSLALHSIPEDDGGLSLSKTESPRSEMKEDELQVPTEIQRANSDPFPWMQYPVMYQKGIRKARSLSDIEEMSKLQFDYLDLSELIQDDYEIEGGIANSTQIESTDKRRHTITNPNSLQYMTSLVDLEGRSLSQDDLFYLKDKMNAFDDLMKEKPNHVSQVIRLADEVHRNIGFEKRQWSENGSGNLEPRSSFYSTHHASVPILIDGNTSIDTRENSTFSNVVVISPPNNTQNRRVSFNLGSVAKNEECKNDLKMTNSSIETSSLIMNKITTVESSPEHESSNFIPPLVAFGRSQSSSIIPDKGTKVAQENPRKTKSGGTETVQESELKRVNSKRTETREFKTEQVKVQKMSFQPSLMAPGRSQSGSEIPNKQTKDVEDDPRRTKSSGPVIDAQKINSKQPNFETKTVIQKEMISEISEKELKPAPNIFDLNSRPPVNGRPNSLPTKTSENVNPSREVKSSQAKFSDFEKRLPKKQLPEHSQTISAVKEQPLQNEPDNFFDEENLKSDTKGVVEKEPSFDLEETPVFKEAEDPTKRSNSLPSETLPETRPREERNISWPQAAMGTAIYYPIREEGWIVSVPEKVPSNASEKKAPDYVSLKSDINEVPVQIFIGPEYSILDTYISAEITEPRQTSHFDEDVDTKPNSGEPTPKIEQNHQFENGNCPRSSSKEDSLNTSKRSILSQESPRRVIVQNVPQPRVTRSPTKNSLRSSSKTSLKNVKEERQPSLSKIDLNSAPELVTRASFMNRDSPRKLHRNDEPSVLNMSIVSISEKPELEKAEASSFEKPNAHKSESFMSVWDKPKSPTPRKTSSGTIESIETSRLPERQTSTPKITASPRSQQPSLSNLRQESSDSKLDSPTRLPIRSGKTQKPMKISRETPATVREESSNLASSPEQTKSILPKIDVKILPMEIDSQKKAEKQGSNDESMMSDLEITQSTISPNELPQVEADPSYRKKFIDSVNPDQINRFKPFTSKNPQRGSQNIERMGTPKPELVDRATSFIFDAVSKDEFSQTEIDKILCEICKEPPEQNNRKKRTEICEDGSTQTLEWQDGLTRSKTIIKKDTHDSDTQTENLKNIMFDKNLGTSPILNHDISINVNMKQPTDVKVTQTETELPEPILETEKLKNIMFDKNLGTSPILNHDISINVNMKQPTDVKVTQTETELPEPILETEKLKNIMFDKNLGTSPILNVDISTNVNMKQPTDVKESQTETELSEPTTETFSRKSGKLRNNSIVENETSDSVSRAKEAKSPIQEKDTRRLMNDKNLGTSPILNHDISLNVNMKQPKDVKVTQTETELPEPTLETEKLKNIMFDKNLGTSPILNHDISINVNMKQPTDVKVTQTETELPEPILVAKAENIAQNVPPRSDDSIRCINGSGSRHSFESDCKHEEEKEKSEMIDSLKNIPKEIIKPELNDYLDNIPVYQPPKTTKPKYPMSRKRPQEYPINKKPEYIQCKDCRDRELIHPETFESIRVMMSPEVLDDMQRLDQFQRECLLTHNMFRVKHRAPPLKWNSNLSKQAQIWANYLVSSNTVQHSNEHGYSENVLKKRLKHSEQARGFGIVEQWYKRGATEYDYSAGIKQKLNRTLQAFVKMVWSDTRELGVGYAFDNEDHIIAVSLYKPKINVKNISNNVFPKI